MPATIDSSIGIIAFFMPYSPRDRWPGRDMAGLMRHHPDQLIGVLQPQQDAGEDENILAAVAIGGKGIDLVVANQPDLRDGIKARGARQRRLVAPQHLLGFGVAQYAHVVLGPSGQGIGQKAQAKPAAKRALRETEFGVFSDKPATPVAPPKTPDRQTMVTRHEGQTLAALRRYCFAR